MSRPISACAGSLAPGTESDPIPGSTQDDAPGPWSTAAGDPVRLPPVTMLYMERPTYYYTDANGNPAGQLMEPAMRIMSAADLDVEYLSAPPKRILEEIADPDHAVCSPGWFLTPEREKFARFSAPFARDEPLVALMTQAGAARLGKKASLRELLTDQSRTLGILDGFSYGEIVDDMLAHSTAETRRVVGNQRQLALMLAHGRIDYLLIAPEEIEPLLRDAELPPDSLAPVPLADAPAGNLRRIMCGAAVDPEVIRRIDAAIAALIRKGDLSQLLP